MMQHLSRCLLTIDWKLQNLTNIISSSCEWSNDVGLFIMRQIFLLNVITPNLGRKGRWWPMWWMRTWFCNALVLLWIAGRKELAKSSNQGRCSHKMSIWASEVLIWSKAFEGLDGLSLFSFFLITEMLDLSGDASVTYSVVSRLKGIPWKAKIDKFGIRRPLFSPLLVVLMALANHCGWMIRFILQHDVCTGIKKDSDHFFDLDRSRINSGQDEIRDTPPKF